MTYSYPISFFWAALALALLVGAYWCYVSFKTDFNKRHLLVVMALSLIYLIYVPQFFIHELRLDEQQLDWKDGHWWKPKTNTLRFNEVASICTMLRSSGRSTNTIWRVTYQKGGEQEFLLSELLSWHASEIRVAMQRQGIAFKRCTTQAAIATN